MVTNAYTGNSNLATNDTLAYLDSKLLELPQKQLVAYKLGDPITLPKGRGLTYTAVRYERLPLPFAPLAEGVPPIGETLTTTVVTGTVQQWGDKLTLTDVAELATFHRPLEQAGKLLMLQIKELLDRNTFNTWNSGTQVNYVNTRGSRAAVQATDYLDATTVSRTYTNLFYEGAPEFNGSMETDTELNAESEESDASNATRKNPHYMAIVHPFVENDLRNDSTVKTAWQYSDVNKLYNGEIGEWGGMTFCKTNLVPSWVGVAQVNGTAGSSGSLATGTYYVQVTGSDNQNQYESRIYQVSASVSVTGPTGSISVTLPSTAGFTYSVYIGTTTSPANLALSSAGPSSGSLQGQATQMTGGQTVVITGTGVAQTPPAAPATGVSVYPTYVLGRGAFGQIVLDGAKWNVLKDADKSDPLNQLRVYGYKIFYGTIILNNQFFARIESSASTNGSYA